MKDQVTQEATARRRALGRALRDARLAAGLTQSTVADELGCSQGKINKIETTLVRVDLGELEQMIALYRVTPGEADRLSRLAIQDHRDGPRRTGFAPAWSAFSDLSESERVASEIRCWHSERIPGTLQSEHYMLQMFQTDQESLNITKLVKQRRARAGIFTQPDPPPYRAILSESSLRRMPGGRLDLIIDQAEHLLNLVDQYDQIKLQILPFNANVPFVDTDFQILHFEGEREDFAYTEGAGGARIFKSKQELDGFSEHWNMLHGAALHPRDSQTFLRQLAERARTELRAEKKE